MEPYTERRKLIDEHAYKLFAGNITPKQLIGAYSESSNPISDAIDEIATQWDDTFDQPAPDWLKMALKRYILANTGES